MVHIQGEFKESLNLPEKRNPWTFFHSPLLDDFQKWQKSVLKSNKPNESYKGVKKRLTYIINIAWKF